MSVHLVVPEMLVLLHAVRFYLVTYKNCVNTWINNFSLDGSDNQVRPVNTDALATLFNENDYHSFYGMYTTYARRIRPTIDMHSFALRAGDLEIIEPMLRVIRHAISNGKDKNTIKSLVHDCTEEQSINVFCQCIAAIARASDMQDD
jgi:hypothetical protein